MKPFTKLWLAIISLVATAIPASGTFAGGRLVVVTQPEHTEIVSRLLGPQVEVRLLLPLDATSHTYHVINTYVRGLGKPDLLLIDSRRDDGLRQLWCERLVNVAGTSASDIPSGVPNGADETQRSAREFASLAALARGLGDHFPDLRSVVETNLQALLAELGYRGEGATPDALAKAPAHPAP